MSSGCSGAVQLDEVADDRGDVFAGDDALLAVELDAIRSTTGSAFLLNLYGHRRGRSGGS